MAENGSNLQQFKEGVFSNNPVLVQLLGMCPTLAVTNSLENALVMGMAVTFVVVMSNLITSLLRNLIKPHVRILIFTITIATFVTIADLALKAYLFDVARKLGAFVPLIIVNCIIICRAEVVAIKSGVSRSLADALGIGLGFTMALCILGVVREVLGSGTLLNQHVLPRDFIEGGHTWVIMVLPPGAFLTLGAVVGVVNHLRERRAKGGAA
ncbi:MAG TPA: electron transport complex subunit RsxE [Phycisphaerae bacterium]|nr:electron transport complex subunit RsxE [Phycisphaerae bacterium]HNU44282.1 electron transport complex subunit RsxE [Phycisphaerae bacterium]